MTYWFLFLVDSGLEAAWHRRDSRTTLDLYRNSAEVRQVDFCHSGGYVFLVTWLTGGRVRYCWCINLGISCNETLVDGSHCRGVCHKSIDLDLEMIRFPKTSVQKPLTKFNQFTPTLTGKFTGESVAHAMDILLNFYFPRVVGWLLFVWEAICYPLYGTLVPVV